MYHKEQIKIKSKLVLAGGEDPVASTEIELHQKNSPFPANIEVPAFVGGEPPCPSNQRIVLIVARVDDRGRRPFYLQIAITAAFRRIRPVLDLKRAILEHHHGGENTPDPMSFAGPDSIGLGLDRDARKAGTGSENV